MSSDHASAATIAGFPALETGKGSARPPVVFIHGSFATHLPWQGWMEEFPSGFTACSFHAWKLALRRAGEG